jgi:acetyltransferase-like isoleucine patch superfamily enzyme
MWSIKKFFYFKCIILADKLLDQVDRYRAKRILSQCASTGVDVRLQMPLTIYHPDQLTIGNQVAIGEYTHIRASGGVSIGNRVLVASHVVITSRGHPKSLPRYGVTDDAPITIKDDVWIGAGAIILPGVTIGEGAIIGAGSVVTTNVAAFTVVGGIPTRPIGQVPMNEDDTVER